MKRCMLSVQHMLLPCGIPGIRWNKGRMQAPAALLQLRVEVSRCIAETRMANA